MSRERYFYGVLDSDTSKKEVICDGRNNIETRIVLRDEEGHEFTLVTNFNGQAGTFSFTVEGENRHILAYYDGRVYDLLEQGEEE